MLSVFKRLCSPTLALSALMLSGLAACAYQGGDIGDPVVRKTQWFSFAGGDDIRKSCAAGTPDRYRLIYNGIYDEQVRIYEVDSLRRLLIIRVIDGGNVARIKADDLAAPWRAKEEKVQLDQGAYDTVVASFRQGGMFAPPPVGLELPSRSFYWLASTCRDGVFGVTAWKYPSEGFNALGFDKTLFALDPSGVAVNQAGPRPYDETWEDKAKRLEVPVFSFKVTENGLLR